MTPYRKHVYRVSTYTFRLGYPILFQAPPSLQSPPPTSSYTLKLYPPVGAIFIQFVLSEESNRRIENHNFSFEFEKYIFCVLGQNHFQREKMKLQLLTCGLVFGQKEPKPTFEPEQSIKRYTSIRNQYAGLFSITFQFDLT